MADRDRERNWADEEAERIYAMRLAIKRADIASALRAAAEREREACAQIADECAHFDAEASGLSVAPLRGKAKYGAGRSRIIAQRIRARGRRG